MKQKKIIAALLLAIITCLLLLGCAIDLTEEEAETVGESIPDAYAKITYENFVLYGTGRHLAYTLTYDYDYFKKRKASLTVLLNNLKQSFETNGYSVSIDTIKGYFCAAYDFETTEEYYRAAGYDGFNPEENDADVIVTKSAFYNEYSYTTKTVFVDVDKNYKFVGRILSEGCTKAGIPNEQIKMIYVYGTPYGAKTISTDADETTYSADEKLYFHKFYITQDTLNREIHITQRVPNTTVWYVIAVAAGLVVFAVPLTIFILRRKKKKE